MSVPAESPSSLELLALTRLLGDARGGGLRPLREYLEEFPGAEPAVAREWLRLRAPTAGDPGAAAEDSAPDEAAGRVGPFVLEQELGRGGQGSVWAATDTRLGRRVALKLVPRALWTDGRPPRFEREARAASRLSHPGLCSVFETGHADGLAWMAMELVPGRGLDALLAERDGPAADVDAALALVEGLARALHAAHEAGVVHRDVKPSNVVVTPEGRAVLLDFGVAQDLDQGVRLTRTGDVLGTPAYMAPEQLEGRPTDARSDVWSLGATAYELLTGERPFDGTTLHEVAEAVRTREPRAPSRCGAALPRDVDVVLATALAKEPARRYRSAQAFADDVRNVREHRPVLARPTPAHARVARWFRRNPQLGSALVSLFVVLVGALAVTAGLLRRTQVALDANRLLVGELSELSDAKLARDLLAEERELWPADATTAPAMARWLARAEGLGARLDAHRQALARIEERVSSSYLRAVATSADTKTNEWAREQLESILATGTEVLALLPEVRARHALATGLRARTLDEPRAAWVAARERVRADPRFGGLELEPQLGLLPLGPDPVSGLEEFAHLPSGAPARRDPATGALRLDEESGVVLVLIPGGTTTVGRRPPDAGHPEGTPFVDPLANPGETVVADLPLDPFLLSKYELTVAQWRRQTRESPALYASYLADGGGPDFPFGLRPVEQVDWHTVERVLAQLALTLPTDVQWEHAARAGTTTPFYTGETIESLAGHANLADANARGAGGGAAWTYEPDLRDPFVVTAPIGSLAPNPWGLHDVVGNVYEWTRSRLADLTTARPGDGHVEADSPYVVVRGGSFPKDSRHCRSGQRNYLPPHVSDHDIGVRPSRPLLPPTR